MKKIDRSIIDKPRSLDFSRQSPANKELCANIIKVENGQYDDLKFNVYRLVKSSVEKLTGKRCAYCGVKEIRSSVEVEHYRPKKKVEAECGEIVPGYFWLAACWDNLIPACQRCNGSKIVNVIKDSVVTELRVGKKNYFPLLVDTRQIHLEAYCEKNEIPLLYNPCSDDPTDLFDYKLYETMEREYLIVVPKILNDDALDYKRAKTSIELLGLNEVALAEDRREIAYRCLRQVEALNVALGAGEDGAAVKREALELYKFIDRESTSSYIGLCELLSNEVISRLVQYCEQNSLLSADDLAVLRAGNLSVLKGDVADETDNSDLLAVFQMD